MTAIITPCRDYQGRTCLEIGRGSGVVRFIPLDIAAGLVVNSNRDSIFDARFKPMTTYPVKKAVELYVRYATEIGATKEALQALAKVVSVPEELIEKITTRLVVTKAEDGTETVKKVVKGERTGGFKPKEGGSASQLFKELILAGGQTNLAIFKAVQAKYGLSDDKLKYVNEYRSKLKRQGHPVPPRVDA